MIDDLQALRVLAKKRWHMAITLSVVMVLIYFGFLLLVAFNKEVLGSVIVPGLSVGILLGAMVIVLTWAVTLFYVRWANANVDGEIERLNARRGDAK
jgi:uncharacterized membrane protein (DUF485 family)